MRAVDSHAVMPHAWATLVRMRVLVYDWPSAYSPNVFACSCSCRLVMYCALRVLVYVATCIVAPKPVCARFHDLCAPSYVRSCTPCVYTESVVSDSWGCACPLPSHIIGRVCLYALCYD